MQGQADLIPCELRSLYFLTAVILSDGQVSHLVLWLLSSPTLDEPPQEDFPQGLPPLLSGCEGSRYLWQTLWMQGFQDQQELAGTTFPVGKHAYEGYVGCWWPPGLFLWPGCPCRCAHLSSPVLFRILADPAMSSWHQLGNTFTENETRARKEHPPYTLVSCSTLPVHRPHSPPATRSLPRLGQEEGQ